MRGYRISYFGLDKQCIHTRCNEAIFREKVAITFVLLFIRNGRAGKQELITSNPLLQAQTLFYHRVPHCYTLYYYIGGGGLETGPRHQEKRDGRRGGGLRNHFRERECVYHVLFSLFSLFFRVRVWLLLTAALATSEWDGPTRQVDQSVYTQNRLCWHHPQHNNNTTADTHRTHRHIRRRRRRDPSVTRRRFGDTICQRSKGPCRRGSVALFFLLFDSLSLSLSFWLDAGTNRGERKEEDGQEEEELGGQKRWMTCLWMPHSKEKKKKKKSQKRKCCALASQETGKIKERERGAESVKCTHTPHTHTPHTAQTHKGWRNGKKKKQNKTTPVCFFLETCTCSAVVNDGNERLTAGRVRSYVF